MKHLKYFPDSQIIGGGVKVDLPNVSYLEGKNTLFITGKEGQAIVKLNNTTGEIEARESDYATMYLTFEAIENGTFKFSGVTSAHTLSYSLDDGTTWTSLAHNTNTPTINAGNKIIWKGNLTPQDYAGIGKFVATGKFDAYGNIMSLLYGDNFVGQISLTGKTYAFYKLFSNTEVVSAQNLILPATTLAYQCYKEMFFACTSLTTAPVLPATTLASSCYDSMFRGCKSLTTAPELPVTTLATACYSSMFNNCTGLTTAPALPATILTNECYFNMFSSCISLTTAPELPATTLTEHCYYNMFEGCTNLTYLKMLCGNDNEATRIYDNSNKIGVLYIYDNGLASNDVFLNQFIGWELYLSDIYIGIIEAKHGGYYEYSY